MRIARIPPTLAPPSVAALTRGIAAIVRPGAFRGRLERELRILYPRTDPVPFASGRAALATAIMLAMRATGRRVVVLPAYTSYSVAAAAAMAGARVRLCDLDPDTLDFDRDDLRDCVDEQVAAVVLGNLYGYPSAISDLRWVGEQGALLIDDAAQALGALDFGEPVGGRADLGVLSFGRGKCVTTGDGGALLIHDADLHAHLSTNGQLPPSRGLSQMLYATAVKLSSSLTVFGMLSRLPGAQIGESVFEPDFEIRSAPASVNGLASDLPTAVWQQREMRTAVAESWTASLRDNRTVRLITPREQSQPSYLRFPVLTNSSETRERLKQRLARRGFTYVNSYPTTLGQIEAFRRGWCDGRPTPKAEWFAERVIALPCHARVSRRRVRRAARAFGDSTLPAFQSFGIHNTLVSTKVS